MSLFGGAGTIFGPLVGAVLLASISEVLATEITGMASLFFGLVIVVAVVFMPRGLSDLMRRFPGLGWRYFRENLRLHRL
jgi:branched-chain amino acid transport system permease protein